MSVVLVKLINFDSFQIIMKIDLNNPHAQNAIAQHLYGKHESIEKMTKEQLINRLSNWETLWTWLPPECQFLISKIGEQVAIVTTNEGAIYGDFMGFNVEVKEYVLESHEEVYDHNKGRSFLESNRTTAKKSYITRLKWLGEKTEIIKDSN